eukprot:CAMPEP_0177757136 /NCGR_PEP_ID=MMETSP0491_2-20121128/3482_1 /TAXON_ID=63592 /ORGANISM="Tetraselmis chuii, Strain PLY429" /LENGTH=379 /DNA_ID=CAMNT_0019272767 /DNA_START=153 /DNA_END=1289 /DNA_ORIENTATION=-
MASAETSVTSDTGGYAGEEETVTISLVEDSDEVVNLIGDGDKEAPDATEAESLRPPPPPALLSHPLLQPAGLLWNAGIPCCVISSLFFSVNAVVVKSLQDLPVFQIALARSVVSIVTTLGLMYANNLRSLYTELRSLPFLMARGLVGSSAMLLFYVGLQSTPLADAQTVFFLYPAATALMAFLLLGERLGVLQVAGVLASVAGVVLIAHPPMLFGGHSEWGAGRGTAMGCLVGAALLAATAITIIRKLANVENSIVMAMWFHLTAFSVSVPALALGWPKYPQLDISAFGWACLLGVGFTSFTAQLLFNRGIQLTTGATAACIASLQVPLAYVWGIVLFSEAPTLLGTIGSAVVIFGLIAVNVGAKHAGANSGVGSEEGS